jgi:hypothetical protein
MRFMKPSSTTLVIVKGREGDAEVANQACLRSDLVKNGTMWALSVAEGTVEGELGVASFLVNYF